MADRRALRNAQQGERLDAAGLDHRFEIIDQPVVADVADLPVRQSDAAGIVAQQLAVARELMQQVAPHGAGPVELQMVDPVRDLEQRRP